MTKYKCHKVVEAEKILSVEIFESGSIDVRLYDGTIQPFASEWATKFNPKPGGYVVFYADGYASFSPAKAFEEGYTKI